MSQYVNRGAAGPEQAGHGQVLLIADMDEHTRSSLQRTLARLPWQVRQVGDANAIARAVEASADDSTIVLVRYDPLRPEAADLAGRLRALPAGSCYIMFVLDKHDPDTVARAFRAGADDVVTRPILAEEIEARIQHAMHYLELARLRERLGADKALMAEIATTAVVNSRNYLNSELRNEVERSRRYGHSVAVVLAAAALPLPPAERVMRTAGRYLLSQVRGGIDWVARYDRSCFALVLPETALGSGMATAERLSRKLAGQAKASSGVPAGTSWYFGVSAFESVVTADASATDVLLVTAADHLAQSRRNGAGSVRGGIAAYRPLD